MPSLTWTAPRMELEEFNQKLEEMSEEEKEEADKDIQGEIQNTTEETEEFIHDKLTEFDEALSKAGKTNTAAAYRTALDRIPDFVRDDHFRLMFLRSEQYRTKDAAERMIQYWDMKVNLFGSELAYLPRHIRISDLSEADLASLDAYGIYLIPKTDKTGRALIVFTRRNFVFKDRKEVGRLMWYLFHVAAMGEESVQKSGFVMLVLDDGPLELSLYDRKLDKLTIKIILQVAPLHFVAAHHCFDSRVLRVALPFLLFMIPSKWKARFRLHPGHDEHNYNNRMEMFEACGIPKSLLPPIIRGGTLQFDAQEWKLERLQKEDESGLSAARK